jgi:hypothetical protein
MGRELLALALKKPSPIVRDPITLGLFVIVYLVFEFAPSNKVSEFFRYLGFLIGFLEGLVQFKLFTICLRNIRGSNPMAILGFSLFYGTYDILAEVIGRALMRFRQEPLAGVKFWVRTLATFGVYWQLTHENYLSKVIGVHAVIPCAVIFAIGHGIANSYVTITGTRASIQRLHNAAKSPKTL